MFIICVKHVLSNGVSIYIYVHTETISVTLALKKKILLNNQAYREPVMVRGKYECM